MFNVPPLPRTLQAAERDLSSEDPKIRASAAHDLRLPGQPGEREARVRVLVSALSDADSLVRKEALLALADHRAVEALPQLLGLLAHADPNTRQMAVLAVGEVAEIGDKLCIGPITALLGAGSPALRYQALVAVVRLNPVDARENILRGLSDTDAEIRGLALRLLEEHLLIGDVEALDAELEARIHALAKDKVPAVALVAQLMGGELGLNVPLDLVIAVVNGEQRVAEPRDEQIAIELCGRLRLKKAARGLKRRAFGGLGLSFDPFRWQARAGLAALGNAAAMAKVRKCLASGKRQDRTLAVFAVGQVGLHEAQAALERLSGNDSAVDQEVLADALARLTEVLSPPSARGTGTQAP